MTANSRDPLGNDPGTPRSHNYDERTPNHAQHRPQVRTLGNLLEQLPWREDCAQHRRDLPAVLKLPQGCHLDAGPGDLEISTDFPRASGLRLEKTAAVSLPCEASAKGSPVTSRSGGPRSAVPAAPPPWGAAVTGATGFPIREAPQRYRRRSRARGVLSLPSGRTASAQGPGRQSGSFPGPRRSGPLHFRVPARAALAPNTDDRRQAGLETPVRRGGQSPATVTRKLAGRLG